MLETGPSPRQGRMVRFVLPLLVATILFGIHIRSDLYGDELGHTQRVVSAPDFWQHIFDPSMSHPPLYFASARICHDLVGADWALRIPSFIAALLTIMVLPLAARVMSRDYRLELAAVWFAALSPFLVEFAAEGRPYALLVLFATASCWAFMAFLRRETARTATALAVATSLGFLTHYFFGFLFAALGLVYLGRRRRFTRLFWAAFLPATLVAGVLAALLFFVQSGEFHSYMQVDWTRLHFRPTNFMARLAVALNYGFCTFKLPQMDPARNVSLDMIQENWHLAALAAVAMTGLGIGWLLALRAKRPWVITLSVCAVIPIAIGLTIGLAGMFMPREKYLAVVWPIYALIVLSVTQQLLRSRLGRIAAGAHVIVILVSLAHYTFQPNTYSRRMDWTGLCTELRAADADADLLLVYSGTDALLRCTAHDDPLPLAPRSLSVGRDPELQAADYASALAETSRGTVYLVNDETDRHVVDPNRTVIARLSADRETSHTRFGRNLILYTFRRKPPAAP